MGKTPLEGLVMATRCGDVDPAIPLHLAGPLGLGRAEADRLDPPPDRWWKWGSG